MAEAADPVAAAIAALVNPRDSLHHRFVDDVADAFLKTSPPPALEDLLRGGPFAQEDVDRALDHEHALPRTDAERGAALGRVLAACAVALAVGRARLRAEPMCFGSMGNSPTAEAAAAAAAGSGTSSGGGSDEDGDGDGDGGDDGDELHAASGAASGADGR